MSNNMFNTDELNNAGFTGGSRALMNSMKERHQQQVGQETQIGKTTGHSPRGIGR